MVLARRPRCLVLGATGFIGRHLVSALVQRGYYVRAFRRCAQRPRHDNVAQETFEGDFTNKNDVRLALTDMDLCFHLASTVLPADSNGRPQFDIQSNLVATVQMLELAVEQSVKKIVFSSSGGTVYGTPLWSPIGENHPTRPTCSYGINKLAIENYLELFKRVHGLEYVAFRISNVYGPGQNARRKQGAIAVFVDRIMRREPIEIWGDGSVIRDYIYVSDVIDALIAGAVYSGNETIFNVGSGLGTPLNDLLSIIETLANRPAIRTYLPRRAFDVASNVLDITRADKELLWRPQVTLEMGIEPMISSTLPDDVISSATPIGRNYNRRAFV